MCGLEFPDLEKSIYQKYRARGVTVVGVNPDPRLAGGETPATLKMFAKQTQVTFPIGLDASQSYHRFAQLGAISPFPLDVIVDRSGTIAYVSREYDGEAIVATIEKLLANPEH